MVLASHEDTAPGAAGFHAWDPGLEPGLPRSVRPLASVFRPDNVENSYRAIEELSDLSGLPATQLALFRPERLVVHEVLIRVMADLSVPIGAVYADLGVNFRRIVATILHEGIASHRPEIAARLDAIRAEADAVLDREIAALFDEPTRERTAARTPDHRWGWLSGLFARGRGEGPPASEDWQERALRRLDDGRAAGGTSETLQDSAREALRAVVASLSARQGFLIRDATLLRSIAAILVSNDYGGRAIGAMIEPWIEAVIDRQGYRRLKGQDRPIVLNVKGASASGKSTIRPYQRELAERIGADWSDFAVITPDVWRKFLLDYDSLGQARLYAGPLTGHEVEIVDAKLDRHMARKAAQGRISHLLIDRFRFDSFAAEPRSDAGSGLLLTRFGHRVHLQFMITPPEATVERAWKRGQLFGRYKAVEDLLAHNVEAYAGMPRLFFLWALRQDKTVFFEFLDNSVPDGERPRTIAFGTNGAITILDARALLDIDRFRKIDIHARGPEQVHAGVDRAPERNAGFLRDCLRRLASVRFAEWKTGCVFARFERTRLTGIDRGVLARVCADEATLEALLAAGLPREAGDIAAIEETLRYPDASTLGAWGPRAGEGA